MSTQKLQALVGGVLVNDEYRAHILNGQRAELIADFDLSSEEIAEVMAIQANDFSNFAAKVEQLVNAGNRAGPD